MQKKHELFQCHILLHNRVVSNPPKRLFPQETDWTCSIACIRTILSGVIENVPGEAYYVNTNEMRAGPYYSRDIKELGILNEYDVIYGCDEKEKTFDRVLDYVEDGYFVMLESMYNYAHWFVLLGYYPLENGDVEKSRLLLYDPYYDETRLLSADEFLTMWIDGNFAQTKVEKDFIALR